MTEPELPARRRGRTGDLVLAIAATGLLGMIYWSACWNALGGTRHPREFRDDAIRVSGELRADGSCTLTVDGEVIADGRANRTDYEHDMEHGTAPDSISIHHIDSTDGGPTGQLPAWQFFITLPQPLGAPLRPGRWRIAEDATHPLDTHAADFALFHPRFGKRVHLESREGYLRLTQIDSPRVVGTFTAVGRRVKESPIE